MDEKWIAYFEETDPAKRGEMLGAAEDSDRTSELIRSLYAKRYTDKGADRMISLFLALLTMAGSGNLFLKHSVKSIRKDMKDAGFDEAMATDEGREILYHEIKNGMKRYLETCTGDMYGAGFSGLIRLNDAGREAKTKRDLTAMTRGATEHAAIVDVEGFEECMKVLSEAVRDEYKKEKGAEL